MTTEDRNIKLKHLITCMKCEVSGKVCDENCPTQYEAGNMGEIIENLEAISEIMEHQPCENCISRKDMLAVLRQSHSLTQAWDGFEKLPSVTPKEKTGMWINDWEMGMSECSCCGETYLWEDHKGTENFHYCPNCGARMV